MYYFRLRDLEDIANDIDIIVKNVNLLNNKLEIKVTYNSDVLTNCEIFNDNYCRITKNWDNNPNLDFMILFDSVEETSFDIVVQVLADNKIDIGNSLVLDFSKMPK